MSLLPRNQGDLKRQGARSKKALRQRPDWDSTLSDLTKLKASEEELARRRQDVRPTNIDLVKREFRLKKLQKALKSPAVMDGKVSRSAVLKEILYSPEDLETVLARSDHTMALVRDLFGDQAGKFPALTTVTRCPASSAGKDSQLPAEWLQNPHSSSSAILPSLLNGCESDSDSPLEPSAQFDSQLDIEKYKKLLAQIGTESIDKRMESESLAALNATPFIDKNKQAESSLNTLSDGDSKLLSAHNSRHHAQSEVTSHTGDAILHAITDLKRVVESLSTTPRSDQATVLTSPFNQNSAFNTFSSTSSDISHPSMIGYSSALIRSLCQLTEHLNKSEEARTRDATALVQLEQQLEEQQLVIDALTQDVISAQKESVDLRKQLGDYRAATDKKVNTLTETLHEFMLYVDQLKNLSKYQHFSDSACTNQSPRLGNSNKPNPSALQMTILNSSNTSADSRLNRHENESRPSAVTNNHTRVVTIPRVTMELPNNSSDSVRQGPLTQDSELTDATALVKALKIANNELRETLRDDNKPLLKQPLDRNNTFIRQQNNIFRHEEQHDGMPTSRPPPKSVSPPISPIAMVPADTPPPPPRRNTNLAKNAFSFGLDLYNDSQSTIDGTYADW